jgi:hypothetical protein
MADIEYFDTDDARGASRGYASQQAGLSGPTRMGTLVNWAGAFVSLGLVVGMGVWAWQLTMRDVSGVPVIRALEGPMRVPPADPGGVQAQHQGLAVNRIAEGEEAGPVPDQLVLAPPPVDLDAVDLVSSSAAVPAAPPASAADSPASADTQALIDRLVARAQPLGLPAPVEAPLLTDSDSAAAPAPSDAPPPSPGVALPEAAPAGSLQIIAASVPGVARSLRPPTRPVTLASARSPATSDPAEGPERREIAADSLPEGTRLVQLGAFDSAEIARAEWDRLSRLFPDFFDGRASVIQQASSGGSDFYRLRAHGFEDLAASRRFCAVLVAQNTPCIPVTVR